MTDEEQDPLPDPIDDSTSEDVEPPADDQQGVSPSGAGEGIDPDREHDDG